MKTWILIVVAAAWGAYMLSGVWETDSRGHPLVQDTSQLQTGDLLFVRGTSWRSRIVLLLSRESDEFSHVGLVLRKRGAIYVIHATPEPSEGHEDGTVVIDPLKQFLSPEQVLQAALYRVRSPNGSSLSRQAAAIAQKYAVRALPFDHNFDASTPGELYCTELVWRAYLTAGVNLLQSFSPDSNEPLLPVALTQSRLVTEVARYQ